MRVCRVARGPDKKCEKCADARIRLHEGELDKIKDLKLSPGMPVEVMITTGETTLLNYLVQPFTDLMRRGISES